MKYMVTEYQDNGTTVGNQVFAFDSPLDAESKYYAILSAAAVSKVPIHTAYLETSDGRYIDSKSYDHRQSDSQDA